MIEHMGKTPEYVTTVSTSNQEGAQEVDEFRITARSIQVNLATVVLQSNYTKPSIGE